MHPNIQRIYPNKQRKSLKGYEDWDTWTEEDFQATEWSFLDEMPVEEVSQFDATNFPDISFNEAPVSNNSTSWFNENDPNAFNLPETYDPVYVNELPSTISNSGLTEAYVNQFQIPGTSWADVLKDIGSTLKEIAVVGTPIAATALQVLKSNTVSTANTASLSNSLKQMGILSPNQSVSSLTSLANSLGITTTSKPDLQLQQEIALLLAKKELETQNQNKKDDWVKYSLMGAGILFGLMIVKKM